MEGSSSDGDYKDANQLMAQTRVIVVKLHGTFPVSAFAVFFASYFYENGSYSVGEYCKTIEGFMVGFTEFDPIVTEDDIPEFISNEDLLEKCLKYDKNATRK